MSNPHRIELRKIPIERQVLDLQIKCHLLEKEIEQLRKRLDALKVWHETAQSTEKSIEEAFK